MLIFPEFVVEYYRRRLAVVVSKIDGERVCLNEIVRSCWWMTKRSQER